MDRAVVFLVDGLGASALTERAGHARTLAGAASKSSVALSGFPSTTATGLATLTTATHPGVHGMVGYTAYDPGSDRVVELLKGWGPGLDPATWQRSETVFERAGAAGVPSFAVGVEKFRSTGFTEAVLRGAEFHSGKSVADRVDRVRELLDANERALVYVYAAELDHASHSHGKESPRWLRALETVDAAVTSLAATLGSKEGMLVTADHGSLDVPRSAHIFFDRIPGLIDGVRFAAGEPRGLQLHFEADASRELCERVTESWRASEADRAWVFTRPEAIAAGLFGPSVDPEVAPRIGDLIVAPRKRIAYYDSRADEKAQSMVGQHGSLTDEETRVPLLRFGAFARGRG
ncbi:MAG TPA: alkaline phosphatase family protein, partial [Terrimesophilobacter sp.]|nr:alkaline phosphatase family protein [Terrimesophilobacter sp.]